MPAAYIKCTSDEICSWSYDIKSRQVQSIAEKFPAPWLGIEPRWPLYKTNALTNEQKVDSLIQSLEIDYNLEAMQNLLRVDIEERVIRESAVPPNNLPTMRIQGYRPTSQE